MPKQQLRIDLPEEIPSSAVSEMVFLKEKIVILLEEMTDLAAIVSSVDVVNELIIDYIDAWDSFPSKYKHHNDWQIANRLFRNKVADYLRKLIVEVSIIITSDESYDAAYRGTFHSLVYGFQLIDERDTHVSRVTLDRAMVDHSSICIPARESLLKEREILREEGNSLLAGCKRLLEQTGHFAPGSRLMTLMEEAIDLEKNEKAVFQETDELLKKAKKMIK